MVSWLDMARIVRGQTLSLKRKSLLRRHKLAVYRRRALLFAHCAECTRCGGGLRITSGAQMILFESFLSFLGLGTQEPLRAGVHC